MNIYIAFEINLSPFNVGKNFTVGNFLFGTVGFTTNADPDKYKYCVYAIGFNARGSFLLSDGSGFGKNVIIFSADMSSSVHADNKKKDILILSKDPTS